MKKLLVLFFLICHGVFALSPTKHVHLPPPYSYLENLYFDCESHFIALGEEVETKEVMLPVDRGFELVSLAVSDIGLYYPGALLRTPQVLEGTTLLLMESKTNFLFHFFHLLEHLVGAWAFYGHEHAHDVQRIVLAADGIDPNQKWNGPNQINEHLLRALFPNAQVMTWQSFLDECRKEEKKWSACSASSPLIEH